MALAHTRTPSPELTGGAGFVYEAHVAACYLVALLGEGSAPGLNHRIARRVALQQKSAGEPLDDVIVDAAGDDGEARLSLQVKRQLTISSAPTNTDFREVVLHSWLTLQKPTFRENVDRYGAATGTISADRLRELRRVCELARVSLDAKSFLARGGEQGNAGKDFNAILHDFRTILVESDTDVSDSDLHRLLKHFVVITFDFLDEESTDTSGAVETLRAFLLNERQRAPDLWQQLVGIARNGAGRAAEYDRPTLVSLVGARYRLAPAPSLRADLDILARFSAQGMASITADIAGTRIDRTRLLDQTRQATEQHRFVQIRGMPGTGKSVLLRDFAAQYGTETVLFLKSDRLHGSNWIEFASTLGLAITDPRALLTDLAASGSPILFLDGIDRISGSHRNIVIDLLNTMFASSDSPWRVIASLRDTGIEPLRTWLPLTSIGNSVGSVEVLPFSDAEAESLSAQQPALQPLLLGNPKIRSITRRPFFASILAKAFAHTSDSSTPAPQSELDLIGEWWKGGGYGAEAASVLLRKRALLEIAGKSAGRPGMNVRLSSLTSEAASCLHELMEDGIIQAIGNDDGYRFTHDIYFEWSFYQVLRDREENWLATLVEAGEPPVLGRVVELLAQTKFASGDWPAGLRTLEASHLRTQWLRTWLIGPLMFLGFEDQRATFESVVTPNGYQRLNQLLVWFQAERTTPNTLVLENERLSSFGLERIQLADQLGWPSDPPAWRRLIDWSLEREDQLPASVIPNLVSVFEVWQNAFSMVPNPTSQHIVGQALHWLIDIENRQYAKGWPKNLARWQDMDHDTLEQLESSIRVLVLTSALAYPAEARRYLVHLKESERHGRKAFSDVLIYSTVLARAVPDELVDLFCNEMLALLPEDQLAEWDRQREEQIRELKRRRTLPENERKVFDRIPPSLGPPSTLREYDWSGLGIHEHHGHFFPASPLREPFRSLFEHSPRHALDLVRTVANHATTAWRQLHRHAEGARGTPLPLMLDFPWGQRTFWGSQQQYSWFRGARAPYLVASSLMALEHWAFREVEKGRPVDTVVQHVLEGHDNWSVLGIATALYLETQQVSPVSAVLIGSQRLWKVDLARQLDDHASKANLTGFGGMLGEKAKTGQPHYDAVKAGNQQRCRQWSLRDLTPLHVFAADDAVRTTAIEAISTFPDHLPFNFEEEAEDSGYAAELRTTAEIWAEWAKPENYKAGTPDSDSASIPIQLHNPRAQAPDVQASLAQATASIQPHSLLLWADRCLEADKLLDGFTLENAVEIAQSLDHPDLFNAPTSLDLDSEVTRSAVCGIAAIAKRFIDESDSMHLSWAADVISRGSRTPAHATDTSSYAAANPWHPSIFIARACVYDIRYRRNAEAAKSLLYELCGHPVKNVSQAASEAALSCWNEDDRFAWIALDLIVRLAEGIRRDRQSSDAERAARRAAERGALVHDAQERYARDSLYPDISAPPPPWTKSPELSFDALPYHRASREGWRASERYWNAARFGEVFDKAPLEQMVSNPDRREQCLCFLDRLLSWTLDYLIPPWERDTNERASRDTDLGSWVAHYARAIARIAPQLGFNDTVSRYLKRIFPLEDELCASFLNPFVSHLTAQMMDEKVIVAGTVDMLLACADRLLADNAFVRWRQRDVLPGFDLPYIVRNLFFVGIEEANGAARFANGDWQDIDTIMPIVDKLVRSAGWMPTVMDRFLTLCERASKRYPSGVFADQVRAVLDSGNLSSWRDTSLASRIASLVQLHADRDAPLALELSRTLLQILDHLVDMGDRRSAALQISETFRDIRLPMPA